MKTYVGTINRKRVEIKGETLKEAMDAAGYMPLNSSKSHNRLVGQLTTGERFSFNIQARNNFGTALSLKERG